MNTSGTACCSGTGSKAHPKSPRGWNITYLAAMTILAVFWWLAYSRFLAVAFLLVFGLLGMAPESRLGAALEFFIFDTVKILLLLAALIIESLLGFTPREMAAEWFIFMLGSAYSVISDLRAGIWDRHLKANTKTNVVVSVAGGAAVFVWGLIKFAALGAGIAVLQAVIMGVCTWVLCFALLQLSMKAYKKRHAELENPKEDDDENE